MQTNNYTKKATLYASVDITETGYLAYRDILGFIPNEFKKGRSLDFGCGSGRSTRFLQESGFDVAGLDISRSIIDQAKNEIKNQIIFYMMEKIFLLFVNHLILSFQYLLYLKSQHLSKWRK